MNAGNKLNLKMIECWYSCVKILTLQSNRRVQTVGRKLTQQSARIQKKSSWIDSNVRNKYKLKKTAKQILTWKLKQRRKVLQKILKQNLFREENELCARYKQTTKQRIDKTVRNTFATIKSKERKQQTRYWWERQIGKKRNICCVNH